MNIAIFSAIVLSRLPMGGDPPTAQQLIDQAAPGSVVIIRSENRMDGTNPLVINKPLTLVAKPRRSIFSYTPTFCADLAPAVLLQGPGQGTVALYNFDIGGRFNDRIPEVCSGTGPAARIAGGGFESLELYECSVISPQPIGELSCFPGDGCYFEGFLHGASAIDVDVGHVLVVATVVAASPGWTWDECRFSDDLVGFAGITSTGIVEVFDSEVMGAEEPLRCVYGYGDCWLSMPGDVSSRGPQDVNAIPRLAGPGVRAQSLLQQNSLILGGAAPRWVTGVGGPTYDQHCGFGWDGLPFEPVRPSRSSKAR